MTGVPLEIIDYSKLHNVCFLPLYGNFIKLEGVLTDLVNDVLNKVPKDPYSFLMQNLTKLARPDITIKQLKFKNAYTSNDIKTNKIVFKVSFHDDNIDSLESVYLPNPDYVQLTESKVVQKKEESIIKKKGKKEEVVEVKE